jgi:dTMP kinase
MDKRFIVFEGIDGSGKTTQSNLLEQSLKEKDFKVCLTKEPGGTKEADEIRTIVKKVGFNWEKDSEILLFLASRIENVNKVIKPALKNSKIVICDRFIDSTIAYQHYGFGYNKEKILDLHQQFNINIKPDLTILLDLSPKEGLKRDEIRGDVKSRFEQQGVSFLEKVRKGFLQLAKNSPNYLVLDASENKQIIQEKIQNTLFGTKYA